jgi:hypothetical protein
MMNVYRAVAGLGSQVGYKPAGEKRDGENGKKAG